MNPLLALQAQTPDIAGSYMRGFGNRAKMQEVQNQDALRQLLQDQGSAIMQGDTNALAQLAQYDPQMAWGMQGDLAQRDLNERQFGLQERQVGNQERQFGQSLAIDQERLGIARQEAAQRAREAAFNMDAAERALKVEEGTRIGAAATLAWQQGPEAWDKWNDQFPDYENIPHEAAPMAIAAITGSVEGFQAPEPIKAGPGDTFLDPQTLQPLASVPEAVDQPTSVQEYLFAQEQGERRPYNEWLTDVKKAGANNITTNVGGETAWDNESAKLFAKRYDDMSRAASNAQDMLGMYDIAEQAFNSGVRTGVGGEAELGLRRMGQALGIGDADKIAGGELVRSVQNRLALTMRNPDSGMGMPGAVSDRDITFLKDSQVGLDRSPEGNRQMLEAFRKLEQRKIEIAELADQYIQKNGRLDTGFNDAVREFADANPMFENSPPPDAAPRMSRDLLDTDPADWTDEQWAEYDKFQAGQPK